MKGHVCPCGPSASLSFRTSPCVLLVPTPLALRQLSGLCLRTSPLRSTEISGRILVMEVTDVRHQVWPSPSARRRGSLGQKGSWGQRDASMWLWEPFWLLSEKMRMFGRGTAVDAALSPGYSLSLVPGYRRGSRVTGEK